MYLSRFYRSPAGDDAPIGYQGGRRAGLGFVVAGAFAVIVARTTSLLITPQEVFGNPEVLRRLAALAAVERPRDPSHQPRPR